MEKQIKVDKYNFKDMPIKNWKFYQGITEIKSKKLIEQMIRNNVKSIYAKYRNLR